VDTAAGTEPEKEMAAPYTGVQPTMEIVLEIEAPLKVTGLKAGDCARTATRVPGSVKPVRVARVAGEETGAKVKVEGVTREATV